MSTSVTFNGTTYSIPAAGELNWSSLSAFLVDVGNNAAVSEEMKQAIRVATTSPVTVSSSTDCTVVTDLSVAGAVTVNLPAGANKQLFIIVDGKGDALTNNITINRNGSDTIAGSTSLVLNHNRQTVFLQYHAATTDWKILANVTAPADLDNKQPLDATLTALAGYNTNGIITQTAADTFTGRTITAGSSKVSVTNGSGVAGNPTVDVTESNILLNNLGGAPLNISAGGTGQITATEAFDALAPTTTTGDLIYRSGTDNVRLPIGTDGQVLKTSSGIPAWGDGGAGAGEINAILNPSAASATTGWSDDANHSKTRLTSGSPLDPVITTAFRFTKDNTNVSTESSTSGVYYPFTLPTGLESKKLKVEFYCIVPATGVWKVSVYDGTTRLALSTDSSGATTLPAGVTGKFVTYFDATANNSYTVSFTETSGVAVNLDATNIIVGPGIQPQGAVVGEWQTFTPTGSWTSNVTYTGYKRRVGSSIECVVKAIMTGAPSPGVGLRFTIPDGLTINTSALAPDAVNMPMGDAVILDAGSARYIGYMRYSSSSPTTTVEAYTSPDVTVSTTSPMTWATNDVIICRFTAPIAEWAGSGTVNLAQNDVEYASTSGAWTGDSSATQYGPSGQIMSGALTVAVTKTVTWLTPVQPTDTVEVQLSLDGTTWFRAESRAPIHLAAAGAIDSSAGVRINGSSGTTTSIQFARYQLMANDDSPVVDWVNTMYWRCIKYKSGSPCGFGLASTTSSGLVNPYTEGSGVVYTGTYTPTVSGASNCAVTPTLATYVRVGKVVQVMGYAQVDVVAANASTEFFITLPIASNLALATDLNGVSSHGQAGAPYAAGRCIADTTNDKCQVAWYSSGDLANRELTFSFTYIIK